MREKDTGRERERERERERVAELIKGRHTSSVASEKIGSKKEIQSE